jgi:putative ubiquitin-RnfH superfamily antitoxin RatB of RatAB toxin-antitoxin module
MVNAQSVEVVYVTPSIQCLLSVPVTPGMTIRAAIEASGILQRYPEIDLTQCAVGIFAQCKDLAEPVNPGDRIEIYRPLTLDPKQARLLRVKQKKQTKT